ncbi:hypothetical protein PVAND_009491 [Polypedilum vanderplanki]|uniref:Uncharacterized protein n=1 Tax=Polypedilum vanderplanki TaxID=319348 RepID=A0A9J6CCX4_POLVA|nr:hypothetical protein PVAND_009491 [Polypedilum vanderplanki]
MKFFVFLAFLIFLNVAEPFALDCDFFETWFDTNLIYGCWSTILRTPSTNTVTSITGVHVIGKSNCDVTYLDIRGNFELPFFPKGIASFFPNVVHLLIGESMIPALYGDELNNFPHLERFLFAANRPLTTIPSRLFEKTPKVTSITIYFTNLQRVGHNLFKPLNISQLQYLILDDNLCVNRRASTQTEIRQLIGDLQELCPYPDENLQLQITSDSIVCRDEKIIIDGLQEELLDKNVRIGFLENELQKMIIKNDELKTKLYE